jgi:peptidoglycan/xylan/chitin deacetylase (PgdA/CDA1 family)
MKKVLFSLLHWTCVLKCVSWLNRRKVTILCYHSITASEELARHDPHKLRIPVHRFQEQLDHLRNNYRVISLTDFLVAKRKNRRLPDYSVVLMFDDGFQDFLTVAADHLVRWKLPATVFIITDRANNSSHSGGETYLSWPEVQQLAASGIQIGSHTCSHPRLLDLPFDELRRELAEAQRAILNHVNQGDVPLSYPYGQTSEVISELAQTLGYSSGITGRLGPNVTESNLFLLNRTVIASDDDLATFAARVSGLTWWASKVIQLFGFRNSEDWDPAVSALRIDGGRTYDYSESTN